MSSILLVDSSIWIDHYRQRLEAGRLAILTEALQEGRAALAPMVWIELMVGFRSEEERAHLGNVRSATRWQEAVPDLWERAARHAETLRGQGVMLRMADLLVLTQAEATDSKLFHCDTDFDRVLRSKTFSRLRIG